MPPPPDLRETVARLAALDPADPATPIELAAAAKAHGTSPSAMRQAVALARQQAAAEATPDDPAEPPPETAGRMTAEERQAEIARLAALPRAERDAQRAQAAERLGMTRANLDKALAAERARQKASAEAEARSRPDPAPGEVMWPPGIRPRPDGLYADAGDDAPPLWLAAPFEVLGEPSDDAGRGWGLFLQWRDRNGRIHAWPMPMRLVMAEPGALEAELVDRGLRISADPAARLRLRMALAEVRTGRRVRLAHRAGWQDLTGGAFLLPDGEVIGGSAEDIVLNNPSEDAASATATAGTLDGWQREVAALAVGNPLAAFCLSAAFAGPLLLPLGETGGGFHLTGDSKRGKTTAVQMGLSAWGLPYKGAALRDWNSTANAFEAAAEEWSDMLLTLDELHQANPADVARAAYALADGAGKGALNRDRSARRRRTWRAFILSTGEHDLATAASRAGGRLPAGADVRLPSIPVPDAAEAWPCLHGRDSLQALWTGLHRSMRATHGEAARAFLACLAAAEPAELREVAEARRARIAAALPADADPQVREVARRFALVATAGELAREYGVLPWPEGEAERAALAMLAAWLQRRPGGAGSGERAAHLRQVRLFLTLHGAGRFVALTLTEGGWTEAHPDRPVQNRAGWRKPRAAGGGDEYLIAPEVWAADLCAPAGLDPRAVARTLAEAGFLRRSGDRLTVRERVPGLANPAWVYAVSAALMEADADVPPAGGAPEGGA